MNQKLIFWVKDKIGWQNGLLITIFLIVILYSVNKKKNLINNAVYTNGISDGLQKGARGHIYLHYHFLVDNVEYKGDVPETFCEKCKNNCCDSGTLIIVRYEYENPKNNDLVVSNPNK
ncbi:MAG TPA: hypothetical protein VMT76_17145 [Puia sp.]|nr:hypothetical protein [Puia sp.]